MNESNLIHIALQVIVGASILHIFLPPYDIFKDFPSFQRYYKLVLALVGYLALNVRTKMIQAYPSAKAALPSVPDEPKDA
jgi:hypothetical protein